MTGDYERWLDVADREAVGDALSESERAFLASFAETDPRASAELGLWEEFSSLGSSSDELGNRRLADAAVRAVAESRRAPVKASRSWWVWSPIGVLAAAAAVALFASRPKPVTPVASGVVEYVAAGARVAGRSVANGAHVAMGAEIDAVGGPVCVAMEPRIHACLAGGARLRLSKLGAGERHVDLLEGSVAVALFPLPPGQRFSVVANGTWSTAVGTAFTVTLEPGGTVETIVHEGRVAVGRERGADVVQAHKIGLVANGSVSITPLEDHARTETPEWAALATVAQRSIEALPLPAETPPPAAPKVEPSPDDAPSTVSSARSHKPSPGKGRADTLAPVAAPITPSAEELLAVARQALREQRWSDAASAYRRIVISLPASPEAHTVLVPLARLEIERLDQPATALNDLDAYLVASGPLDVEARLAQVAAYRKLGDAKQEARAIDEFLAAHPQSLEAGALQKRRAALGEP